MRFVLKACVTQGFHNGNISVGECNVLAYKTDYGILCGVVLTLNHILPFLEIGNTGIKSEMIAYYLCKTFLFKHKRYFVKRRSGKVLDNVLLANVTEAGNLISHILRNLHLASANENVGLNAE